jgi:hypothetical protein
VWQMAGISALFSRAGLGDFMGSHTRFSYPGTISVNKVF